MANFLKIVVVDPDPDYLGIEIFASSCRFSGATKIYAGLDQLKRLADAIHGFPEGRSDERKFVFGTKDKGFAGGYCSLRFYCKDELGHGSLAVELEDDGKWHSAASATFAFPVLAADIDAFVQRLRAVNDSQSGEAELQTRG
jgi:hypothetical protein